MKILESYEEIKLCNHYVKDRVVYIILAILRMQINYAIKIVLIDEDGIQLTIVDYNQFQKKFTFVR